MSVQHTRRERILGRLSTDSGGTHGMGRGEIAAPEASEGATFRSLRRIRPL